MTRRSLNGSLILLILLLPACSDDHATDVPSGAELYGTLTVDSNLDPVNGVPSTNAFNHLIGVPVDFRIAFTKLTGVTTGETFEKPALKYRRIVTDGATFSFTGDPTAYLQETVTPDLQDTFLSLDLTHTSGNTVRILQNLVGTRGDEYFGFEIHIQYDGTVDAEGYPVLEDFSTAGTFILRRYTDNPTFQMTDFASGNLTIAFRGASKL